jgi:hypothetical protein
MAVQVKVITRDGVDVYNFTQGAGWVEKDNGSLSIVNKSRGEMALFRQWDSVLITDDEQAK